MFWVAIRASVMWPRANGQPSPPPAQQGKDAMSLTGRSAIITGANQGLGHAIATAFVDAGASVLLVARGADKLAEVQRQLAASARPGQVVAALAGDVSCQETCNKIVEHARKALPGLTVLVNN